MRNPGLDSPQTWTEIDLGELKRNFARFASAWNSKVGIIVSAKKDAYGHGLIEVARALAGEPRLRAIGVATAEEAFQIRSADSKPRDPLRKIPILCFSVLRGDELREAICQDIQITITDADDAGEADRAARKVGLKALAHWKIDTGMGRLGRIPCEALSSADAILKMKSLDLCAVYTHLADGWNQPKDAEAQWKALFDFFKQSGEETRGAYLHIGGSDALSLRRSIRSGAVRSGIALFGYHPGISKLEPVMTFKSRVLYRRRAKKGTRISYGGTFVLKRDSQLALVGAGYGNGYLRALSNRGEILLQGKRCPVLGRVCMDQIVMDVTDCPSVVPGDEAILFGKQGKAYLGADEVADRAGTIAYELLCLAGNLNPRAILTQPVSI